jgi:hypothetical protein
MAAISAVRDELAVYHRIVGKRYHAVAREQPDLAVGLDIKRAIAVKRGFVRPCRILTVAAVKAKLELGTRLVQI